MLADVKDPLSAPRALGQVIAIVADSDFPIIGAVDRHLLRVVTGTGGNDRIRPEVVELAQLDRARVTRPVTAILVEGMALSDLRFVEEADERHAVLVAAAEESDVLFRRNAKMS